MKLSTAEKNSPISHRIIAMLEEKEHSLLLQLATERFREDPTREMVWTARIRGQIQVVRELKREFVVGPDGPAEPVDSVLPTL